MKRFIYASFLLALATHAQAQKDTLRVTGVLRDAAGGKPLPAINVSVTGYSAALTDDNGRFTIRVPDYDATIFVSGQGFQSKEIALKGRRTVEASIYEENFASLYDLVQLPFGSRPRNQSVNAAASVNLPGSWYRSTETPDGILQGKVAGLTPVMRSGTPGLGAWLSLRGYNSLHASNQPLIIVDGMIYDITDYGRSLIGAHYSNALEQIDVRDIENISVIKDGVSTYGVRAANGVIMITTNHAHDLATRIEAGVYGGVNFAPKQLPVMKASDFRVYLSDVLKSRGWTDAQIQAQPYMNDDPSNPYYYLYHNQTDWQKVVQKNTSLSNYYLKITGGDDIARYALSMGYSKNAGITDRTDLTKYSVRFNSDLNLSRRLTAGTNLSFTYYEQNLRDQGLAIKTSPLLTALIKSPFMSKNDIDSKGQISPNLADTDTLGISNPAAIIQNAQANAKNYRFFGSINLKYQLTKYITLQTLAGMTVDKVREQTFIPRKGVANDTLSNGVADSRSGAQSKRILSVYTDTWASYARTFQRIHRLDVRAGFRFLNSTTTQNSATGANSATDDFVSVGTGVSTLRRVGGGIGSSAWGNHYLSADYSLNNKYFASVNLAIDGSSRFGDKLPAGVNSGTVFPAAFHMIGNNFAIMPSVGLSWLVSSERFMAGIKAIDVLKLRASYSRTGNDDIGDYTAQQTYSSQNLLGMQGLVRANVSNPTLLWETNNKINLGIDAALFNERLSLSVDVFKNTTSNMITFEALPAASGFNFA
ncbi:MAG: SusC/RagA family TonB-linked outer membrane protein, partial [Bacteroidetes bacterium]|nr:SusC/RagA family TonB-linked outer membrane protein [Bacteroidota bacterium]